MTEDTRGGPGFQLIGRRAETERIDLVLDRLKDSGSALLVRGEPGIGKSSLLQYARERAGALDAHVLHTGGVESEAELAFAGLLQLLESLNHLIDLLPEPQRRALLAAFGIDREFEPDPFLVALAASQILRLAAGSVPIVLIVDDGQWLDGSTVRVLTFIARRLGNEPITLIAAVTSGYPTPLEAAGVPIIELRRLGSSESAELLDRDAPDLHPVLRARVLAESQGNPLALVELARGLPTAHNWTDQLARVPATLTTRLERSFASRLGEMPDATRLCLLAAALDSRASTSEILGAASTLNETPVDLPALDPAAASQLIEVVDTRVRFRHPLIRSGVRQAAFPGQLSTMYAALARVVIDPERRLWHLAMSTSGPDDAIALALDEHATVARRRGAVTVAAAALERAATLTADPQLKGDRLVRAAEIAYELGNIEIVRRLLADTRELELDTFAVARMEWLGQMLSGDVWLAPGITKTFARIAEQIRDGGDADMALRSLVPIAHRSWWTQTQPRTRQFLVDTARGIGVRDDDPRLLAVVALADPELAGPDVRQRISGIRRHEVADPLDAVYLGIAAEKAGDFVAGTALLARGIERLREQGRLGMLTQALVHYGWSAIHVGDWAATAAASNEAAWLARDTNQPQFGLTAEIQNALVAALQGTDPDLTSTLEQPERTLRAMKNYPLLATAHLARGAEALGDGRHADAFRHLWPVFDESAPVFQRFMHWPAILDLVEAGVGCGQAQRLNSVLEALEQTAANSKPPILCIALLCARPLLTDHNAEPMFNAALEHDMSDFPFQRARMLFSYGRWLRRHRRTIESRDPLRSAIELFEVLGATRWTYRARQELRAAGETSGKAAGTLNLLTAQELQIAQLAADGLSNREIGERLFLSHRTIGSHLYRIFPKLDITARSQLRDALVDVGSGGEPRHGRRIAREPG